MFGTGGITAFVVGAMVAASCVLLLACLALKLDEWGIHPLRTLAGLAKRSWFERLLLLFMVGGLVQYAATKGTNGNDRAAQNDSRVISDSGSESGLREGETELTRQLDAITDLCFTSISVSSNFVTLEVAWPTNFFVDGTILDYFAKPHALTNVWQWLGCQDVLSGETNQIVTVDSLDFGGTTNQPSAMFFKVQDRLSCATTMADADGDGLPDVYELYNGTNPYISDYAAVPKLTVGSNGVYTSIASALAESEPYSLISLSSEEWSLSDPLRMPNHPVMIVGPADGTAILRSSAPIGAVLLDQGQDEQTLFRNLYLVLEKQGSFQSGFWVGGNLPWSGVGASPTFENIRIRALYPNTLYYGWHFYRDNGGSSTITNCVMNAANATTAIGVYSYDGPSVSVADSSFINFPTNGDGFATCFRHGTNIVTETAVASTNLSWAGYPLDAVYSTTEDTDGDGLSDYDEVHIYDTDPLMADSDGDGVSDSDEIQEETEPTDCESYCRRISYHIESPDDLISVTNYVTWGVSSSGWEVDHQIAVANSGFNSSFSGLPSGTNIYVKAYLDLNRDGICDPYSDYLIVRETLYCKTVDTAVFDFSSGDLDLDGMPDYWELSHADAGLSPTNQIDAFVDSDADGMINLHEYWYGYDPSMRDGTNTLISAATKGIDDLLTQTNISYCMFTNYPGGDPCNTVERNDNFYARMVDLSCVSVWNTAGATQRCATVVSPMHIVGAAHWQVPAGHSVFFLGQDGNVYSNKVKTAKSYQFHAWNSPANTLDVSVGLLETPLTNAIGIAQVLPTNVVDFIGSGIRLPALSISQDRCAYVRDIISSVMPIEGLQSPGISYGSPKNPARLEMYGNIRGGDSSSPNFLVVNRRPVLLGCHLFANSAPSILLTQKHIQRMMNELSDENGCARYQLEYLDLSEFEQVEKLR